MQRFFKLTNTFICIDLTRQVVDLVNKHDHPALQVIHIFVRKPSKVDTKSLTVFAENAHERGIQIIVHCMHRKDRAELRKRLRGVPKGRWFHFTLTDKPMMFKDGDRYAIEIGAGGVVKEFYYDYVVPEDEMGNGDYSGALEKKLVGTRTTVY